MVAFVLGAALRTSAAPEVLSAWLRSHALVLTVAIAILLVQIHALSVLGRSLDMSVRVCSLPVESLAYAILYSLAAMALARWLPRAAAALATSGRSMIFCYITHSFALAVFYNYPWIDFARNVWVPVLLLILLTWLYGVLNRLFPRAMSFLFGA